MNRLDTSHDHKFRLRTSTPLLEDAAALFLAECRHETPLNTEPGYEGERIVTESIECDETRQVRFEPQTIEIRSSGSPIDVPDNQDEWSDRITEILVGIEPQAESVEFVEVGPDQRFGHVIVEWDDYKVRYTP